MKKRIILALVMFAVMHNGFGQVFIACKAHSDRIKITAIHQIDKKVFTNQKDNYFQFMKDAVKKQEKCINIILKNGNKISFIDKINSGDDPGKRVYEYIGMYNKLGIHLIKEIEYEWVNYIIVSHGNGSCVRLWGMPHISPDGTKLFAYAANLIYDPMPNGLQIIDISRGDFRCIAEYTTEDWEPSAVAWKDSRSMYIKKRIPLILTNAQKDIIMYGVLTIKN